MDVYLVEEELMREENLFSPHETSYKPLEGKAFDIYSFVDVSDDEDMPQIPSSC
jgi:hypothetical protein